MTQNKINDDDLQAWKYNQRILYARCSKSKKAIFCDLYGNYEVYKKGELTLMTNQAYKAVKEYNQL